MPEPTCNHTQQIRDTTTGDPIGMVEALAADAASLRADVARLWGENERLKESLEARAGWRESQDRINNRVYNGCPKEYTRDTVSESIVAWLDGTIAKNASLLLDISRLQESLRVQRAACRGHIDGEEHSREVERLDAERAEAVLEGERLRAENERLKGEREAGAELASEIVSDEIDPSVNAPWMRCSPGLPGYVSSLRARLAESEARRDEAVGAWQAQLAVAVALREEMRKIEAASTSECQQNADLRIRLAECEAELAKVKQAAALKAWSEGKKIRVIVVEEL
jgi:hypothetical protein